MMENRSFDHFLGWLKQNNSDIEGITGNEFNHYNASDPNSPIVKVNQNGYDRAPYDPGHGFDDTAEQIYGFIPDPTKKETPKMNGFAQNAIYTKHMKDPKNTFSMFTSSTASIINGFATDFAVFDQWFCSLPGPTDPNRAFFMSGTSNGVITNFNGTLWNQQSYMDFLRVHNISWRAYYQDDPWAMMYFADMHNPQNYQYVGQYEQFKKDVANGELAQFTLLQPRMTSSRGPPNWQHPEALVSEGEKLYKEIYEILRNSKFWKKLAFIITYDEHGGFYDHVAPPQDGIPNPDGVKAPNLFNFDRLGIRLPTVVISPWIKKGTVVHHPKGDQAPQKSSQYDSTSIMSTVNRIFGVKDHMSKRAEWAGTFEHIFGELEYAREDCPSVLMEMPPVDMEDWEMVKRLPLNDHLETQVRFYCKFNNRGEECGKGIGNQYEASLFIEKEVKYFFEVTLQNKFSTLVSS